MLLGVLLVPQPTRVEANGNWDAAAGEGPRMLDIALNPPRMDRR